MTDAIPSPTKPRRFSRECARGGLDGAAARRRRLGARYYRIVLPDGETLHAGLVSRGGARASCSAFSRAYRAVVEARVRARADRSTATRPCCSRTSATERSSTSCTRIARKACAGIAKAITLLVYFQQAGAVDINPPFTARLLLRRAGDDAGVLRREADGRRRERTLALKPLLRRLAENICATSVRSMSSRLSWPEYSHF